MMHRDLLVRSPPEPSNLLYCSFLYWRLHLDIKLWKKTSFRKLLTITVNV